MATNARAWRPHSVYVGGFMDSQGLPPAVCADEDVKHASKETVDALQNLLYLIREDAGNAHRVRAYLDIADKVLWNMHTRIINA